MPVYKSKENNTWFVSVRYRDWTGVRKQTTKRGFKTKKEAQEWERVFQLEKSGEIDMYFKTFVEIYVAYIKPRIKQSTWEMKQYIIYNKLVPYFGKKKMNEITPKDVLYWQTEMLKYRDAKGNPFSQTYLKTMHNQLSAILNHAVRFYDLRSNPAAKAGNMGKEFTKEMLFWTKDEYEKFSFAIMDKPMSYYAFEILYWCGIREGELLALTPEDFNFQKQILRIDKTYHRIRGENIITTPKTRKSIRKIQMPEFLCNEIQEFIKTRYKLKKDDRLFPVTASFLRHELDRGSKLAGVKRIRVHDLRHSHISLLIDMGFSAVAIADRVGHESIEITYRYAHMFPSKQSEMANKLDAMRNEVA